MTQLVNYGFMGAGDELKTIMDQANRLIDGNNDVPFPPDTGLGMCFNINTSYLTFSPYLVHVCAYE